MAAANSNFTVAELAASQHAEDREVAERCRLVINQIVGKLKPILTYIAAPIPLSTALKDSCPWFGNTALELPMVVKPPKAAVLPIAFERTHTNRQLFISHDGELLFTAYRCAMTRDGTFVHFHNMDLNPDGWISFPFQVVINGIRELLSQAVAKRQQHLDAVRQRLDMLNRMVEAMQQPGEVQ